MSIVPVIASFAAYHSDLSAIFFGEIPNTVRGPNAYDAAGRIDTYRFNDEVGKAAIEAKFHDSAMRRRLSRSHEDHLVYELIFSRACARIAVAKLAVGLDHFIDHHRKHAEPPKLQGDIFDRTTVYPLPCYDRRAGAPEVTIIVSSPKLIPSGSEEDATNSCVGINTEFTADDLANIWYRELTRLTIAAFDRM